MPPTQQQDGWFDPDPEGPGEHDQHLFDDEQASIDLCPCPACGRAVNAHARDCHRCGAEFRCEAWQTQSKPKHRLWLWISLVMLVGMFYLLVTYGTIF